jgi:hypothetical protein
MKLPIKKTWIIAFSILTVTLSSIIVLRGGQRSSHAVSKYDFVYSIDTRGKGVYLNTPKYEGNRVSIMTQNKTECEAQNRVGCIDNPIKLYKYDMSTQISTPIIREQLAQLNVAGSPISSSDGFGITYENSGGYRSNEAPAWTGNYSLDRKINFIILQPFALFNQPRGLRIIDDFAVFFEIKDNHSLSDELIMNPVGWFYK